MNRGGLETLVRLGVGVVSGYSYTFTCLGDAQ